MVFHAIWLQGDPKMEPWLGSMGKIKTRRVKTTKEEPEWRTRVWSLKETRKELK